MTSIVAAFAGTGKTYLGSHEGILDLDSSSFSWRTDEAEQSSRNPDFPLNYITAIAGNIGRYTHILVSSNPLVRNALIAHHMPFTLIYPERNLRQEYLERLNHRGSSPAFINNLAETWDELLEGLGRQTGCERTVLQSGQYLSDVLLR